MVEKLKQLVDLWRQQAKEYAKIAHHCDTMQLAICWTDKADIHLKCANQLEKILSQEDPVKTDIP